MNIRDKVKQTLKDKKEGKSPPRKSRAGKGEMVTHACGHAMPLKSVAQAFCTGCIGKNRKRKLEAWKKYVAKRKQANAEQMASKEGRLPHGSNFNVTYDANTLSWQGALTVSVDGVEMVLDNSDSSLFKLLAKLDAAYRCVKDAVAAQTEEVK